MGSAFIDRIIWEVILGVSAWPVVATVRSHKIALEFSGIGVVVVIPGHWLRLNKLLVVIILIILVRLRRAMVHIGMFVAAKSIVADWANRLQHKFQLRLALFCMANPALVIVNVLL
jgi:hypothetical protein